MGAVGGTTNKLNVVVVIGFVLVDEDGDVEILKLVVVLLSLVLDFAVEVERVVVEVALVVVLLSLVLDFAVEVERVVVVVDFVVVEVLGVAV